MSLEAVRIVADGIGNNLAVFNALLAQVPRAPGDAAPAPVTAVYDRTRTGWVARNEIARQGTDAVVAPFLVVTVPEPDEFDISARPTKIPASAFRLEGLASVSVQYVASRARTELAATEASYTLRALRGWLLAFARAPGAARTLNGVTLIKLANLRQIDLFDPRVDQRGEDRQHVDTVVMGGVLMRWITHEVAPDVPLFDSPSSP